MKDAYLTFLQSTDLDIWEGCLHHYRELLIQGQEARSAPIPRLAEGLCIAQYSLWQASLCGREQTEKIAKESFNQFADMAIAHDLYSTADGTRTRAIIAAGKGYSATAERILNEASTEPPLEIALLVMPTPPGKRAQVLSERLGMDSGHGAFLPAVYFYSHALLDLGYLDRVRNVLDEYSFAQEDPLMIDLQGKLAELSGAWSEAEEFYRSSDWITHRYRASICSTIVSASSGLSVYEDWDKADDKVVRGMRVSEAETDQTEIVRMASFVNACRWYNFDSWLVHYELGALHFRRRRHTEAEEYLKMAAKRAPEAVQFAINDLRFVNLTWINDSANLTWTNVNNSDKIPEILDCAYAALEAPAAEIDKSHIRTYLVRFTRQAGLLKEVDSEARFYHQGEANAIKGMSPEAMYCWSAEIGIYCTARALHRLIENFSDCEFERTASYLIEIAMREAHDNFFDLWELAGVLLSISEVKDGAFTSRQYLEEPISQIATRLEQLAEFEFQHLMRAWKFFNEANRGDLAARVLRRAAYLAESAEEHLALANANQDTVAQSHLLRAEQEATHRLLRIQIARRFADFGQLARARQNLTAAGVFDPNARLEPLEYVIALKCNSPCLTEEERQDLLNRAARHLVQDLRAGLYPSTGKLFLNRLERAGAEIDREILERFTKTDDAEESTIALWQIWSSTLERLDDQALLEEERRSMEVRSLEYEQEQTVLFHHLLVWQNIRQTIGIIRQAIMSKRPDREPSETPIRRVAIENERGIQVSRLWRAHLGTADPRQTENSLEQVREFYREEDRLEEEWEAQRGRDMQLDLQKAQFYVDWGTDLLAKIEHSVKSIKLWPPFLNIEDHMLNDIEDLRVAMDRDLTMGGLGYEKVS